MDTNLAGVMPFSVTTMFHNNFQFHFLRVLNASYFSYSPDLTLSFYRAMHFSAKRGLAIACRPSVRLSVRLSVTLVDCDHIGWES